MYIVCILVFLLQTLLLCFLRASTVTRVSGQLWDNLSSVLSSLTMWKEVVEQWQVSRHCHF